MIFPRRALSASPSAPGTGSSNPSPSSGESTANLTFGGQHPIGNTSGAASTARRWPRRGVARDGLSEREVGHLAFYELVLGSQSDAAVRVQAASAGLPARCHGAEALRLGVWPVPSRRSTRRGQRASTAEVTRHRMRCLSWPRSRYLSLSRLRPTARHKSCAVGRVPPQVKAN